MVILSTVQKPTKKVKENGETEEYVPRKELDKSPQTHLNKTEISDLPDKRVQNNGYKDNEQTWEKNK